MLLIISHILGLLKSDHYSRCVKYQIEEFMRIVLIHFYLYRIIVLDQGEITECDTPANLLADSTGQFYAMCVDANLL